MSYNAAKRLGVLHLHILHILYFLLAYRHHGIRLRQTDERCVIEHSSDDSGPFYQPMLSVRIEELVSCSTHQTSGNNDFEVC